MKRVNEIIGQLMGEHKLRINEKWCWSWGSREECDRLFRYIFREVDRTFELYEHLPEYDEVIDWMTNTDDKGLMLMGDCGRGKSIILNGVLPV
jgi:DNA replication protein DnaC